MSFCLCLVCLYVYVGVCVRMVACLFLSVYVGHRDPMASEWVIECAVRYLGPPELFTMYACLFADSSVQKVSTAWLVSHSVVLRAKCLSYTREHGFSPHPGVLIEMIRSGE
jgi:hypothetical protein